MKDEQPQRRYRIKIIHDDTGIETVEQYEDYRVYLARFTELNRQHDIISEETASIVHVCRKGRRGQTSFL